MHMFPELRAEIDKLDPELQAKILSELVNSRFSTRSHYKRTTQHVGCKGPLCARAARIHQENLRDKQDKMNGLPRTRYKRSNAKRKLDSDIDRIGAMYLSHRTHLRGKRAATNRENLSKAG